MKGRVELEQLSNGPHHWLAQRLLGNFRKDPLLPEDILRLDRDGDFGEVQNFVESIAHGDTLAGSFSLHDFGTGHLDFTPLLRQSTRNTQIGTHPAPLPKPSSSR